MNNLDKKITNKVSKAIDKAILKHNLINDKDRVLVGISGGIDSLVLLENLAYKKKYYKTNFELYAVHININNIPYSINNEFLKSFCDKIKVELKIINRSIEIDNSKLNSNPCFICSWNRRKLLFNFSKENNFNKLALGHHKDDAVNTFLMNLIYHGSISSIPAGLDMFNGKMSLIRPMIYLTKDIIKKYAEIKHIETKIKTCSFDNATNRNKMSSIIDVMQKYNPAVRENIFKAMSNIFPEYLPR